jgi:hypothetical protein
VYPAQEYAKILYQERLREAENARLVRAQKRDQEGQIVQLRRRSWIRSLLGRRKALAR